MKRFVLIVFACILAITANAQQLKTAQGITTITTVEKPKKEKNIFPIERGFEQSVELGVSPELASNPFLFLSAEYIAGYRFNNTFFVGGGTGLELKQNSGYSLAIPLYATARVYTLPNSRWQPFFGLSLGAVFCVDPDSRWMHKDVGLHLNPTIGINYRINQKYSCYCTVGYLLRGVTEYGHYNYYPYSANCLSIKLGFTF